MFQYPRLPLSLPKATGKFSPRLAGTTWCFTPSVVQSPPFNYFRTNYSSDGRLIDLQAQILAFASYPRTNGEALGFDASVLIFCRPPPNQPN